MKLCKEEKEDLDIINTYVPHNGFFDLSNRPEHITNAEYAKILKTQNYLAEENKKMRKKEVRKANVNHWEELKKISADLQGIIFSYWDYATLN